MTKPTTAEIQRATADHFDVLFTELTGPRRHRTIAQARMVAMYLCRKHLQLTLSEIGERFGNRDHTTAMNAVQKITAEVYENQQPSAHAVHTLENKLGLLRAEGQVPITLTPDGAFHSFEQWVNKARSWIGGYPRVACFDQKGRLCTIGKDFARARDEGAFPVVYFVPKE